MTRIQVFCKMGLGLNVSIPNKDQDICIYLNQPFEFCAVNEKKSEHAFRLFVFRHSK